MQHWAFIKSLPEDRYAAGFEYWIKKIEKEKENVIIHGNELQLHKDQQQQGVPAQNISIMHIIWPWDGWKSVQRLIL